MRTFSLRRMSLRKIFYLPLLCCVAEPASAQLASELRQFTSPFANELAAAPAETAVFFETEATTRAAGFMMYPAIS